MLMALYYEYFRTQVTRMRNVRNERFAYEICPEPASVAQLDVRLTEDQAVTGLTPAG